MNKKIAAIVFIVIILTPYIYSISFSISPGSVIISSDYFNSGRMLTFGMSHKFNILGFNPEYNISIVQANGNYREDLFLSSYIGRVGLGRKLFSPTTNSTFSLYMYSGEGYFLISTENSSETSVVPLTGVSTDLRYYFNEKLDLKAGLGFDYTLDKSNTLMLYLTLGIEFGKKL